jgi:hypothetical protein
MGAAPGAHPLDVLGAEEVITVVGFGEPSALALGLAGAPTRRLRAEALVPEIAWVGTE